MENESEWKTKTCETCRFMIGSQCRQSPPFIMIRYDGKSYIPIYPYFLNLSGIENDNKVWLAACSKWEPGSSF